MSRTGTMARDPRRSRHEALGQQGRQPTRPYEFGRPLAVMATAAVLSGCILAEGRSPLPTEMVAAQPAGYEGLRYWGDTTAPALRAAVEARYRNLKAAAAAGSAQVSTLRADFLALSGGGGDGAFAAGLLEGWNARGDRPAFEVVTGISTGALAAPFAFLGPDYDGVLREIYTSYSDADLYTSRGPLALVGNSLNDTAPLRRLIERYVTDDVLERIAAAERQGRTLIIETTNLDAQRPVIWDLTALAASGRPDRRELFVRLLLASAAIPAVFPAQRFPVTAGGRTYDELHVDGGVSAQVFFAPPQLRLGDAERRVFGHTRARTLYAVRNGKLAPDYEAVEDGTLSVAQRAIATMIKNQGRANIEALQQGARANGARMFYAAVPTGFRAKSDGDFDPTYMRRLYDVGRDIGLRGAWIAPSGPGHDGG